MITGLVLAAGFARRMGRQKLLLTLQGKPILRWSVEGLLPHVQDVIVVTPPDAADLRAALDGLPVRFAVNPRPADGQGSSIAAGMAAVPPLAQAVIVALGDQPRLPAEVVPALIAAREKTGKPIIAPVYQGVQGTPVLFSAELVGELAALSGDEGARSVVRARPERVAALAFPFALPGDVDTPQDYARLHAPQGRGDP
ncbi:MAG: nucleotidyltransferase family protein [Candidatus Rokubacteria bacterium]|nr:nucleotidyltransferase family protein [Candidatus Rokubacteria bacterium]